ncbi:MAG: DoxX family protein [Gammaproteobacteria bacterium]|nr:DoxX family protein [Gammaproteobacteria bacterium]
MNLSALNSDTGKLILRSCVGGLMLFHGVAKVMHPGALDFIAGMLAGYSLPAILAYGVYIGEVLAPLMVIAGYKARLGGILIAVNMLFALALAHTGDIFSLSEHGGWMIELQIFYLLTAVSVAFLGSGSLAVKPD